jgi:hypothetical protein
MGILIEVRECTVTSKLEMTRGIRKAAVVSHTSTNFSRIVSLPVSLTLISY